MARIEFVPDLRREGACGTWGAILLGDGGLCAAMRLPIAASDRATIERVLAGIREVMQAGVPGIAPIADVAVGGNQVWVFVGIAPGPSVADLLYEATLAPADLALIALDAGRALVRLHERGLWHGAFGPDTIVLTRTGAIHLTEAGIGPALDGLDVRIDRTAADSDVVAASVNGVRGAAVVDDVSRNETTKIVAANGAMHGGRVMDRTADDGATITAARAEQVTVGAAGLLAEPASATASSAAISSARGATAPMTDGTDVDVSAWADTVRLFANHLRSARAESEADALATCARRADDDGIVAGLEELAALARTFVGFPDRDGLRTVMGGYAIVDEPDSDTVLRAIDALFDAPAPPIVPPPTAPRRFRSPLGRGSGPNGASLDNSVGEDRNGWSPRIPTQSTGDRIVPAPVGASEDDEAGDVVARSTTAPPHGPRKTGPRKTSVIPTRLPRSTGGSSTETPGGLWTPSEVRQSTPSRTDSVIDAPTKTDNTVRVGRGVPASNGRRPTPARLGRPAWWPRIAINLGIAVAIVLGVGGYVWWRVDRPMHVMSVSVTVQRHVAAACQLDADVVGTVITTGGTGTFTYQWQRSDGTTTAVHVGTVVDPAKPTEVHLPWTFNGAGQETAQVTLVVLTPQRREASTSFEYICNS